MAKLSPIINKKTLTQLEQSDLKLHNICIVNAITNCAIGS
jgi:hypothetical protein